MYVVKELVAELTMIDPHRDRVEIVNKEDSVGGLRMYNFNNGYVVSLLIFLNPFIYRSYNIVYFSY